MRHRKQRRWQPRNNIGGISGGQPGAARGKDKEHLVERALKIMEEEGCIKGFRMALRYSHEDRHGIDVRIFPLGKRVEIALQVKSSRKGVALHKLKYPGIPCINMHDLYTALDTACCLQEMFGLPQLSCQSGNHPE